MTDRSADETTSPRGRAASQGVAWIGIGIVVAAALIGAGGYFWLTRDGQGVGARVDAVARSYRTIGRLELRAEPRPDARVIATLKDGTTLSGTQAGVRDGVEWLALTAVDGAKGYAPASQMRLLGPATGASEVRAGARRVITSTLVNLRATPSLSGQVLGVAEGGTRLVADGVVTSEGEDWLRVPINARTTVFVMQRFTTADDDPGGDGDTQGDPVAIGVRGHAVQVANVQATPLGDSRVVRAIQIGEEVRIIGQTNAGIWWYVLRLSDGSQGFAPKDAIKVDPSASQWVYPDGSIAPGPNVPKGASGPLASHTVTINAAQIRADASVDAETLDTLPAGRTLNVVGERDGWLQVRLADGRVGFIARGLTGVIAAPRPSAGAAKAQAPVIDEAADVPSEEPPAALDPGAGAPLGDPAASPGPTP
jgi:uncharacterized protein YgiM (DUF1202 family)